MATRETSGVSQRTREPVVPVSDGIAAHDGIAARDATDPRLAAGAPAPAPRGDWRSTVITASSLNVLAGIWLIIAPFVLGYSNGNPYWNDILFGAIVVVLGLVRASGAYRESGLSYLNALVGVWVFASAFWLDTVGSAPVNDVILGIVVFVLALVSATASDDANAAATRGWFRR